MLEIKELVKDYHQPSGWAKALKGIDLQIPQGEIIGLFGENGAGKTTLFKCILNFVSYQGTILLDGEKIGPKNLHRLSFATSEHSFFPNLTAESHAQFYRMHFPAFRQKRFRALMDFFELPGGRVLRNFSMGQKNQFEVILALCQGADYILMDEPFAGNDIFNREDFYKTLLGILEPAETVILSTHLIEEVENFVGRALLLRGGKLVGDADILALQEQGRSLVEYVKEVYDYRTDRVSRALSELSK